MSDRGRFAAVEPDVQSPLRRNLLDAYDALSHQIAGGQRRDHRDLLPGAEDPLEGIIPDEFRSQIEDIGEWFEPTEWAGLSPTDVPRADLTTIPAPGTKVVTGNGGDFFRSGEAPNNYVNRQNPLYLARTEFAESVTPRINELFGTTGHAGHYREPLASDAAKGGRSANSDHYSAGAVDFFGTVEQLDALREWAVGQPFVSFVRWRSESHGGSTGTEPGSHLHMSFDLGWIAQNYFQGREAPSFTAQTQTTPTLPPQAAQGPTPAPQEPQEPLLEPPPPITPGRPS